MTVVEIEPAAQRVPPTGSSPWAKQRILETADRLFSDQGIHMVGIDRLISESGVTKATFYKHYGAKDKLIIEYVKNRHNSVKADVEPIVAAAIKPAEALKRLFALVEQDTQRDGFRGCPFVNAATEYPDPRHPVRAIVAEHRDWYTTTLTQLLKELGHPLPGDAADDLMLIRDGAMAGAYAGDFVAVGAALDRALSRVLNEASVLETTGV
ncbi:MAG: TetR/AcrR family transcriptional regulator [Lacisediminihabitans sp.]